MSGIGGGGGGGTSWGASFLRPAKGRRPPLKEKFVAIYEGFFDGSKMGEKQPRRFWDELFLLHVNAPFLISLIRGVSEERLFAIRSSVSEICSECVGYLHDGNLLRVSHALETLILILQYVARKRRGRPCVPLPFAHPAKKAAAFIFHSSS